MKRHLIFILAACLSLCGSAIADPAKVEVLAECSYTEGDHLVKFQFTKREFDIPSEKPPGTPEPFDPRHSGVMFSITRTSREGDEPVNLGGLRYEGGERMEHEIHRAQLVTDGKRVWGLLTTSGEIFHLIDAPCVAVGVGITDSSANEYIGTPITQRNKNPLKSRIMDLPGFMSHYRGFELCKMALVDGKLTFSGNLTFLDKRSPDGRPENHSVIFTYDPKTEKWSDPVIDQSKEKKP